jgi:hypothetical protein
MNENDRELLQGLRALAADGTREAPAEIEQQLRAEFRRHHLRRKMLRLSGAFSASAAAGIVLILWVHNETPKTTPVSAAVVEHAVAAPAAQIGPAAQIQIGDEESDASFYPLPEAEALPAVENAMVVRVQLPVSSLQLMGVPVSEERADASVQADLLLGQDGLARGVRLVQ